MKLVIVTLLLSVLLSSCSMFSTKKPDAIVSEKQVNIHPDSLLPCKSLVKLPLANINDDIVLDVLTQNIEIYVDCKNKQDVSIKLLKQFSNYKEVTK